MQDRLYFYSGSADRPPGQGIHEQVADPAVYQGLGSVPHWRRRLSNFWIADFSFASRTYRTVEHCFQAAKIAIADPRLAESLSLESDSALSQGDGAAARKQRKLVVLDGAQLRAWDARKHKIMRAAMEAKFTQHADLRAVLLLTGAAELWHGVGRGPPPQRIIDLEQVRAALRA